MLSKLDMHSLTVLLLNRICHHIDKFNANAPAIFTSAVIQSLKIKDMKNAYKHATTLMQTEHKTKIDPKHKRKFESLIRHYNQDDHETLADSSDTSVSKSECPHCNLLIPSDEIGCSNCKNIIPFCIASVFI